MKQTPVKKSRTAHVQTVVRGARSQQTDTEAARAEDERFPAGAAERGREQRPDERTAAETRREDAEDLGTGVNVSDASSGRITWKLKPTVLTTVTISRTRRASGECHAQANPSPIALITVGGLSLGSRGTSSSRRIISSPTSTARNVTVLIAKQTPTPKAAISTPAKAGPTTRDALKRLAFSATAFGSSSRPTIWNVSAWRPGASKTSAVLERIAST